MLASPDRELAKRQSQLPGLGVVLDPAALAEAARSRGLELPGGCEASYVRFKPGTRCLVGYGPAGFRGPPLYYASAFEQGSQKLVKALERRVVESTWGPGRLVLEEHAVELCVFPNDDHLKVLIRLTDHEKRRKVIADFLSGEKFATGSSIEAVAYKPERRCVFKCQANDGTTVLIKAYDRAGFPGVRDRARHFCAKRRVPGTQRILGAHEKERLLAMQWLSGTSLADEIRVPSPDLSHLKSAGHRLAELHESEPDGLPHWTNSGAAGRLREIPTGLEVLVPGVSERALRISSRLLADLHETNGTPVVSHGDFHTRQILMDGDGVALLDFDEAIIAPAALDLGHFISRLQIDAARGEVSESVARAATESLIEGYSARRTAPSSRAIRAFTALALLNLADEPFRHHRAEWPSEIWAILDLAERVLDTAL